MMSKKIKRGLISFLILFTFLLSVILALIAYSKNEWNTIASCLAVITALLATYISLRIVWKQEDDLERLPQFQYKVKPHTDEKNFFSKNTTLSNDLKGIEQNFANIN